MADETHSTLSRRKFLSVLGVTGGGAAALSGCSTERIERLVPYLVQSEDQVPGVPTWYASTCPECAAACGLHVKTREGRAIKLEGNPEHPVNRGKLCALGQSSLQELYNPARIRGPMLRQAGGGFREITWDEAINRLAAELQKAGGRVAVLSGAGRGTFSALLADWTAALGGRVVRYEPFDHEPMRAANRAVFGLDEVPAHDFARARYILSFGADFLDNWVSPLENQRGFAESHGFNEGRMAKHVYFGPRMDLTGLNADEWHPITPGSDAALALAMASVIAGERAAADLGPVRGLLEQYTPEKVAGETGLTPETIRRVAREFASARPGIAVAGGIAGQHRGAAEVCAAVNILNYVAGNVGETVRFGAGHDMGDGYGALRALAQDMEGGSVAVLLVHEANPVYTLPKQGGFLERLRKVPFKVSTALRLDETAAECDLLIPGHHALERWDDRHPRAGVWSLVQPVMEPVFQTLPTGDVLLRVAQKLGGPLARFNAPSFEAHLRDAWAQRFGARAGGDFQTFWLEALQRGGVFDEAPAPAPVRLAPEAARVGYTRPTFDGDGEFVYLAYPTKLHDGRGAGRPWLMELPDPVTKITWHSWIEVHPDTARELNVREGEILRLTSPHGTIEAPAYLYPGIHRGVVAAPIGYGRTAGGQFAEGFGVNALDLLSARDGGGFLPYLSTRVRVERTGGFKKVAKTEGNPRQLGRGIAEAMSLAEATGHPASEEVGHEGRGGRHEVNTPLEVEAIKGFAAAQAEGVERGEYADERPKWGMVIDLARCTGCSACVVACYAENNIATVGEEEVLRGREMTWLRIERYWEGGEEGEPLEARFVPMLCQHCGNAPCEPVCPVYAAYHTPDGLNGQVYNRCVGTRYCSNNCPYKVRYFNWYAYNKRAFPDPLNLQLNPDVTVRARGVMEKCTFCVQRIRSAQHRARMEDRELREGEFTTACAQACPSSAIVFGNRADPRSRVSVLAHDPRGYRVLEDVNTLPAITYLSKVLHRAEA